MNIAILGFDREGRSSFEYFSSLGHELTICDQNPDIQIPEGVASSLGENYLEGLNSFDAVVRTPGLNPEKILAKNPGLQDKITSNLNEFLKACPTRNVIGVTGTKGKGTTSTLITKMLEAAGKDVHLGGNIGVPPLELLPKLSQDSWVVLELSSFQLVDVKSSPHIGVCLMVVPEHLDWHGTIDEYVKAKAQLFARQGTNDIAIYFAENELSNSIASVGQGKKMPFFAAPGCYIDGENIVIDGSVVCKTSELKLLGTHNWQNACAAVTATYQVVQDIPAMHSVLTSFSGLEHRLELVRELDAIKYFNDSFAATPDAAIAAIDAIPGSKVMIMGGFDRNLPIEHLAKHVAEHSANISRVIIIGASGNRLASELEKVGFNKFDVLESKDMRQIVKTAHDHAKSGDSVVLSPGFASFDMFKNFEDRGQKYKQAVNNL